MDPGIALVSLSVLDAAEMQKTKDPCTTSSVQKRHFSSFLAVLSGEMFRCCSRTTFSSAWMTPAAVKSRNNLLITFWLYVQCGAVLYPQQSSPVWGVISATMQEEEEEELHGNDGTSCCQQGRGEYFYFNSLRWVSWSLITPQQCVFRFVLHQSFGKAYIIWVYWFIFRQKKYSDALVKLK